MRFLIVIKETEIGFSAYSPDLDGCVSTGSTREETGWNMQEAVEFHLDGMREDGYEVPPSRSSWV